MTSTTRTTFNPAASLTDSELLSARDRLLMGEFARGPLTDADDQFLRAINAEIAARGGFVTVMRRADGRPTRQRPSLPVAQWSARQLLSARADLLLSDSPLSDDDQVWLEIMRDEITHRGGVRMVMDAQERGE